MCRKCIERLGVESKEVESVECMLCSGLLWKMEKIAGKILENLKDYEFETFNVGCRLEGSVKALEEYIFEKYGVGEEKSLKFQFNRELSREIARISGKKFAYDADVTIIYNVEKENYTFRISPLFIYGRYKKRIRGIPQTRWLCSSCGGEGCKECGFTGKRYATSVEELIAEPCMKVAGGSSAIMHGAGREDIDARMLGNGRPFIIEVREPRRRRLNLREIEMAINREAGGKVVVCCLKLAGAEDVKYIKSGKFRKTYRAVVEFEREISSEELENALKELGNRVIEQYTPKRVEHRRAKLLRKRRTYSIRLLVHRNKKAVIEIEAESGLYIKEFVSGDEGRTKPSLSEVLNSQARVAKLDVVRVEGGIDQKF